MVFTLGIKKIEETSYIEQMSFKSHLLHFFILVPLLFYVNGICNFIAKNVAELVYVLIFTNMIKYLLAVGYFLISPFENV